MPDKQSPTTVPAPLSDDFMERLEQSLAHAEHVRRRHLWAQRFQPVLLGLLLVGPLVGWRLTAISGGSLRMSIQLLADLTFALAAMVHVNTVLLQYLGLTALPSVVGILLLALIGGTLLATRGDDL